MSKSLRLKLFLLCVLLLIGFSSIHLLIRYHWTLPQLVLLEVENDKKDIKKLGSAFSRVKSEMQRLVYDNAVWDEMVRVIEQNDIAFLEQNYYIPESLSSLNLNGMHFYNKVGDELSHYMIDNQGRNITSSIFNRLSTEQQQHFLLNKTKAHKQQNNAQFLSGIVKDHDQLILFVSGSIVPSTGIGEHAGTMLVWTYLDSKVSVQLTELMQRDIVLMRYEQAPQNVDVIPFEQFATKTRIRTQNENIYVSFKDIFAYPSLVMAYQKTPRMFDDKLVEHSMVIAFLCAILMLAFIYYLIEKMLIAPLRLLRATVNNVIEQGNYTHATNVKRDDEIGKLANLIDGLFATVNTQQNTLVEANKKLQKLSDTDELTKIANRRALMHFLKLIEREPNRALFPITMIMLDIDHFKTYNDFYGHQAGDKVICQVAKALANNTRSSMDLVARYGGEEFTIMLTQVTKEEAIQVANKLRLAIYELRIPHAKSNTAEWVTISVGLSTCETTEEFEIERLFRVADAALYKAKDEGRNNVIFGPY